LRRLHREPPVTWRLLGAVLAAELAVWALLELIRRLVGQRLDERVTKVWIAGRQLVQNTQMLHTLNVTQQRAAELVEELERHQQPARGRRA
jgi:malonyl CoA-acyl carrier protein transacylase